jgi:hypothetical protein
VELGGFSGRSNIVYIWKQAAGNPKFVLIPTEENLDYLVYQIVRRSDPVEDSREELHLNFGSHFPWSIDADQSGVNGNIRALPFGAGLVGWPTEVDGSLLTLFWSKRRNFEADGKRNGREFIFAAQRTDLRLQERRSAEHVMPTPLTSTSIDWATFSSWFVPATAQRPTAVQSSAASRVRRKPASSWWRRRMTGSSKDL